MEETSKTTKLSGAERIRRYRERKKEEDKAFQANENKRIEVRRKKRVMEMSTNAKLKYSFAAATRKRESRKRKNLQMQENNGEPSNSSEVNVKKSYRSPQALGKAIRKSMKSLPVSPRKKIAVLSGLAEKVGVPLKMDKTLQSQTGYSISKDIETCVTNFYFRSDIAYTAPGVKDEMVVWVNGKKHHLRKYYLTLFLREAYALFKSSHPLQKMSFSKFCELRPKNVLLLRNTPVDQCLCKTHENFRMKLKSLSLTYENKWWEDNLCKSEDLTSECWEGRCDHCKSGKLFNLKSDADKQVIWKEWVQDKCTGRLSVLTKEGCAAQLQEIICDIFSEMLHHTRIKRIQAASFEEDKGKCCVLQVDFAMAYSCEYQNEIQSALWGRQSVQLFTGALFKNGTCKTFLICSDTSEKGKDSVYTFMLALYDIIFQDCSEEAKMQNVIYTDGPSSEFKNRFMVKLLYLLSQKYATDFCWKYFATSHGKGVVDGVGGSAKSLVRQKSMSKSEKVIIQSSKDFAELTAQLMPSTTVLHISHEEIKAKIALDDPWNHVPKVDGIQKIHSIRSCYQEKKVNFWLTAADEVHEPKMVLNGSNLLLKVPAISQRNQTEIYQTGEWCAVNYDGELFAGEIVDVTDKEVKVSAMNKSGKYWKWPERPDVLCYPLEDIVTKLNPPIVAGSRGQFSFTELK